MRNDTDTYDDIRRMLERAASEAPSAPAPERAVRRARRRAGGNVVLASVITAALIAAVVIGVRALPDPERAVISPPVPSTPGTFIHDLRSGAFTEVLGLPEGAADFDASRDGTQLAFTSDHEGTPQIYVMDLNGSDPERVTDDPFEARDPAWSPNGDQIIYVGVGRDASRRELYIVDRDTHLTDIVEGARDEPRDPAWSPDGQRVVFLVLESTERDNNSFWIHDLDRSRSSDLPLPPSGEIVEGAPAWSPNGALVYGAAPEGGDFDILTREPAARGPGVLLFGGPDDDLDPTSSPDGSKVAFWSEDQLGRVSVTVIDAEDGHVLRVIEGASHPVWAGDDKLLLEITSVGA